MSPLRCKKNSSVSPCKNQEENDVIPRYKSTEQTLIFPKGEKENRKESPDHPSGHTEADVAPQRLGYPHVWLC
jgi:hypothetical protein